LTWHSIYISPLNAELKPICQLLALLGAHPILHVSRIRINLQSRRVIPLTFTFYIMNFQNVNKLIGIHGPGYLSRYSDSLWAGRSGDLIPVGARFSAPVQTSPEVHPASCTMGTLSFQEVKRLGRGVDHPPPTNAEVKERVELYLYSPLSLRGPI
jgi:hypothetical protein